FAIHPDGSVDGTLDSFGFAIGDMAATVTGLRIESHGFYAADATLTLPKFLGGKALRVVGLRYDAGKLSLDEASGTIGFNLDKVAIEGRVHLKLFPPETDPRTKEQVDRYSLTGGLSFFVGGGAPGTDPALSVEAEITVESVSCYIPPLPATKENCRNP